MAPATTASRPSPLLRLVGVGDFVRESDEQRARTVLSFVRIGTVAMLAFSAWFIPFGDPRIRWQGIAQAVEALGILVPLDVLLRRGRVGPQVAERVLQVAAPLMLLTLAAFGGLGGDALFWSFVLPYVLFLVGGQRRGWLLNIAYLVVATVTLLATVRVPWLWHYRPQTLLVFGFAYVFTTVTAAYYNLIRTDVQGRLQALVDRNTAEARRHLEALEFAAIHDVPTALPNREGLRQAIAGDAARAADGATAVVALVRFARIGELANLVGADALNAAVRGLAARLGAESPVPVRVARPEVDELALHARVPDGDGRFLDFVHRLEALEAPVEAGGFAIHTEYVVGHAEQRPEAAGDPRDLVRKAEQALLYAIRHGRRSQAYDAALDDHFLAYHRRYERLRAALQAGALALHYQPQLDIRAGALAGVEALVRWHDPEEGHVPPDAFIPILESTGLLQGFSRWTLEQGIADCARWQAHAPGVAVGINLSAAAVYDPGILRTLERELARTALPPSLVHLEVTESAVMQSADKALEAMHAMRAMGVQVAIDDYGVGFSSLSYVRLLPAQYLKIDKAFILGMATHPRDGAIVRSTIALAHDFGMRVVAEGVEDAAAWQALAEAGCDVAQGWHIARALPFDALVEWVRRRQGERGGA